MNLPSSFWRGNRILDETYLVTGARDTRIPFGQKVAGQIVFTFSILGGGIAAILLLAFIFALYLEYLVGLGGDQRYELSCWAGVLISLLVVMVCRLLAMVGMMIGGGSQPSRPNDLIFLSLKFSRGYFRVFLLLALGLTAVSLTNNESAFSPSKFNLIFLVISGSISMVIPILADNLLDK